MNDAVLVSEPDQDNIDVSRTRPWRHSQNTSRGEYNAGEFGKTASKGFEPGSLYDRPARFKEYQNDDGVQSSVFQLQDSTDNTGASVRHQQSLVLTGNQSETGNFGTKGQGRFESTDSSSLPNIGYYDVNDENGRYQHYDIVPFNTDENSNRTHYDAEFFPEPVGSTDIGFNDTIPNLPGFDPASFTPWGSNLTHNVQYLNNSINPYGVNPFLNLTTLVFDQHKFTPEQNFGFTSNVTTAVYGTDANSSLVDIPVSEDFYTWSILIMAPLVIFGVGGNTLVILAISLEKRLQNVTNYFLLSLAVTDLLVSLIVMPLSIINVFTGRWLFGLLLCDLFVTSDVLMCTSSIYHLCTISLERYIGIRYPLWTKNKSKRIVLLKIVLVWTISLAITSPITVLGVVKEDNVLVRGECVLNNENFIIYGSIFSFFIPLAIMVLMYGLTVRMLNNQARLCQSRGPDDGEGQPMIRRSTSRRNWHTRRQYYGREPLNVSSPYSGSRHIEYDASSGVSCQRHRTLGANRHSAIPLCHHHSHLHHHNNDNSVRHDGGGGGSSGVSGSGGGGGCNNNMVGNNNNINNLHRGRGNNNSTGNNNNNSNNTENSNGMSNSNNHRRNRHGIQNGRSGSIYMGRNSPPDYQYCNGIQEELSSDVTSDSRNCCSSILSSSSSSSSPSSSTREPKRLRELVRKHHVAVKAANILLMKREGQPQTQTHITTPSSSNYASVRRDNSVRTEQKASKVLGVVFMIFVVCWAPFFTVNILTALCTSCRFESTLITAFVWLGYVSSTLNPIIYTIFNNIFRITFIKLLCCRYRLLHRARRNSNMPGLRNGLLNCSTFGPATLTINHQSNTTNTTIIDESNC
ncbi:octopamine receptor 1-like [Physella acuta]|uniref:octopamine receptor 1-like n=1 Tax=Physella acuta TaxID=109671 RepID=UPI0027DD9528|nr:octopamine receptor 1-like [Physella acuta]